MILTVPGAELVLDPSDCLLLERACSQLAADLNDRDGKLAEAFAGTFAALAIAEAYKFHSTPVTKDQVDRYLEKEAQ